MTEERPHYGSGRILDAHHARPPADAFRGLLHNMSTPPKSVAKFEGLGELVTTRPPGASGVASGQQTGQRFFGTAVRFELPAGWHRLSEAAILRQLDPGTKRCSPRAREARIAKWIEQRVAAMPLPGGCVLIAAKPEHPLLWDDPLSSLAVLAKCTDTVWLRDKTPSLAAALERRAVSLLVPPTFAAALPSAPASSSPSTAGENHGQ